MVKIIVGTMGRLPFKHVEGLSTKEDFALFLKTCEEYGIRQLDTARIYGGGENERLLGDLDAPKRFTVDTKIIPSGDGSLSRANVIKSINESVEALDTKAVNLLYIHRPDPSVPLLETLSTINEAYLDGKFVRFGICSYEADQVQEIVDICKEHNFVRPSIYQDGYNPVTRVAEDKLFPTLRRNGIAFYAFGPLASGLLAKSIKQLRGSHEGGRFGGLPIAKDAYLNDSMIDAVEKLHFACQKENVSIVNATMRWMQHHSALQQEDGFLIGASSIEQLRKNLDALAGGPLSDELVAEFEALWKAVK